MMEAASKWFMTIAIVICFFSNVVHGESLQFKSKNEVNCAHVPFPPTDRTREVPWATVNLDQQPAERWKDIVVPRKQEIKDLIDVIMQLVVNFTGSSELPELIDTAMMELWANLPEPFQSELVGISRYTNIPVGYVTLYNVFYDIASLCTSVIAQDANGVLYHARNLDYGQWFGWDMQRNTWLLPPYMRKLTVNVRFVNSANATIFESTQFAGYIGILTAVKPNAFSLTLNERDTFKHIYNLIDWIKGDRNYSWTSFLARTAMETQTTYLGAKKLLSDAPLMSTAYFILGGAARGEACVITRRNGEPSDIWEMSSIGEHPWFILQTNYDHWKPQPFYDDRETPGNFCMMKHGQAAVGYSALFDVLSTPPNLNQETVYATMMCTRCGSRLQAYLQYCPTDQYCPL